MRIALPSLVKPHAATEELYTPYSIPQQRVLRLKGDITDEQLQKIIRRAPRRAALVNEIQEAGGEIARSDTKADAATISALVKADVIEIFERDATPQLGAITQSLLPTLSAEQSAALERINSGFQSRNVVLLHGVTSSGKTEIYTHPIAKALEKGEDVLLLVPEISLTSQLVERMQRMFGERVISYHSKLTPARRTQIYMDMLRSPSGKSLQSPATAISVPRISLIDGLSHFVPL